MVNEFCYCPRLFFYEWVEGVFAESAEYGRGGAAQHARQATALPAPGEGAAAAALSMASSTRDRRVVTLSSERLQRHREDGPGGGGGGRATPVDYKTVPKHLRRALSAGHNSSPSGPSRGAPCL